MWNSAVILSGAFREHLKETLVNKLVDLRWHGVALGDIAHWSIFRLVERISTRLKAADE
jgi:hypothetical protein